MNSHVFFDSMHAAGICLGTIQARTHVQLALACQQFMIRVQHRLRFTMQHVSGHSGNLGNECADHAAALGTYGLISRHNVTSRCVRHTFDSDGCFNGCHSIGETLERLQHIRTNIATFSSGQSLALAIFIVFFVFSAFLTCAPVMGLTCSQPFCLCFAGSLLSQQVMVPISSSASTASSIDDSSEHNVCNPYV